MRLYLTPFRKRPEAKQTSRRRARWYLPQCKVLEDRCLLSVSLTPSGPPVPLVGSPVVWTATAVGDGSAPVYQFSVAPQGGSYQMVQDFSLSNTFTWNPIQQGTYDVKVIVKNSFSATATDSEVATYTAESRVNGTSAVITPMSNPLVALYSAPPSTGSSMFVEFSQVGPTLSWQDTAPLPIVPGKSTNLIVAGMLPNTTYVMRDVLNDGTVSAPLTFTTGSLPTNLKFPTFSVAQAPAAGTDLTQNMILHMGIGEPTGTVSTVATDLAGNVDWYYDPVANNFPGYAVTLVPGGTVLMLGGTITDGVGGTSALQEIDLAGDTVRETNVNAINAELAAMGQPSITSVNHDIIRLPNGDTAVIANTNKVIDVNGTPTTYVGDMVLVLDKNFQVSWVWNAFDWLNTNRLPTLGEGPSDWLHANSLSWSPEDGDLIVSLRAQDWVIKIDYAGGNGDGHVVWTLGQGGSFTLDAPPSVASPWFSHQHDVVYLNATTILLFDDGNGRAATDPTAQSRGQEWVLNEQTMTATLVVNANLGTYSSALGSAQQLPNGSLAFTSGDIAGGPAQSIEVLPNGTETYAMNMSGLEYRSYFVNSLYGPPPTGFSNPNQVDLSSAFNRSGIVADGATFSGGGLDGVGNALSSSLLGTTLTGGGAAFNLGPAGASNVVSAAGQTIVLPPDEDAALKLLATGVNGNQVNQTFIVNYTDGTTSTFTQSISDWATPQGFAGESTALTTSHRDKSSGTEQTGAFSVYEYTFALDPTKTVSSITLPVDANVDVLAATLIPASTTQVNLSSAFNRTGIVADGTIISGKGIDGDGTALSSSLVGPTLNAGGATFNLGPAGSADVVSAAGQTIALPTGNDAALKLLAIGVNGDQLNQTFIVTYTDGTKATFTQSISDWFNPPGYAGESTALTTGYRNASSGTEQAGRFDIYEYTFALDPTKTVSSITLPVDANVEVLAATLIPAGTSQVDLSSAFNRTGIVANGATFVGGGLDSIGNAISSSLIGTNLTAGGAIFNLGPAGGSDVVSAAGQTLSLPASRDSALKVLATGVNGNPANQTFIVNYTDGTKATFTQSISDWATPQGFVGESTALTTSYRDKSGGSEQTGAFNVYEYTFTLDPTKTVSSITLPGDANVEVLAATLVPASTTQVSLSSAFNRTGIVADGSKFTGDGLDGGGHALSSSLVGTSLTAGGATFDFGPVGAVDVVSAAGQTIALPSGKDSTLKLLATGVNGNQANQTFIVTYTDGTKATFTQSISDWATPQGFTGESTALSTSYRDTSIWTEQAGKFNVYEYTFVVDSTKVVKSITLPNDGNVEVLAIDALP
jgi:Arylsulfotransferase (ASST)